MKTTRLRPFTRHVVSLGVLAALALSASLAAAAPPATPPNPPPANRSVYQFDVSITGLDSSAKPVPATYTMMLEENNSGELATGTNVAMNAHPGPGGASARMDVGLRLRFNYALRGNVLVVEGDVEMSSIEPDSAKAESTSVHKVRASGVTVIAPGKPALFASVYDVVSHRRYEVTLSAQRVL